MNVYSAVPSAYPSIAPSIVPTAGPTQQCESYNVSSIVPFEFVNQTAFPWHIFSGNIQSIYYLSQN